MENTKITSQRWLGRSIGCMLLLAQKYTVSLAQNNLTVANLYLKIANIVNNEERKLIDSLLAKSSENPDTVDSHASETGSDEQTKGIQEARYVFAKYRGDLNVLLNEVDYYANERAEETVIQAKKRLKRNILLGVVGVFIAAIIIYNLPYCKEWRAYNRVVEGQELYLCNEYEIAYPDGRHLDDVLYLKIALSYNSMPMIVEYLQKCPNGNHASEVNALCDKLWDNEIAKYANHDSQNESAIAVKYMSEMLQYMKVNRVNTIQLQIKPTLQLKDFMEYNEFVRLLLESFNNNDKLPISNNMISLKDNFTQADNSTLINILVEGVQKGINKMFTPSFITVVANGNDAINNSPLLSFKYLIESQERSVGQYQIPNIWTYSENGVAKAYLIGISIKFDVHFSLPGSSTTFDYTEKGEPEDDIRNIDDIRDGYRRMTSMCFAKFSNKMSENMGLEETFFRGDNKE